jgi:hypothetical protein
LRSIIRVHPWLKTDAPAAVRPYLCQLLLLKKNLRDLRIVARLFSRNWTRQHVQKRWPTPKPGGKKRAGTEYALWWP